MMHIFIICLVLILFITITAFKDVLVKDPSCPVLSIKEVFYATNNLCESNFIGEGTAGENLNKKWLNLFM